MNWAFLFIIVYLVLLAFATVFLWFDSLLTLVL